MFQIRGSDGKAYRPGRDIAYLFRDIASYACHRLDKRTWHEVIQDYAAYSGLTPESLTEAAAALARFYEISCRAGVDFATAWVNAGLDRLPKPALMALMFELGTGWTAAWFNAVREVTRAGVAPHGADAVAEIADRTAAAARLDLPSARDRAAAETAAACERNGKE